MVQNFLTTPSIVSRTDVLATLPRRLAALFAKIHDLQTLEPPMRLPRIKYGAYWHERSQKDTGHRWIRTQPQEAAHPQSAQSTIPETSLPLPIERRSCLGASNS